MLFQKDFYLPPQHLQTFGIIELFEIQKTNPGILIFTAVEFNNL